MSPVTSHDPHIRSFRKLTPFAAVAERALYFLDLTICQMVEVKQLCIKQLYLIIVIKSQQIRKSCCLTGYGLQPSQPLPPESASTVVILFARLAISVSNYVVSH